MSDIRAIQELISKFKAMNVDTTEYACLKSIIVLKTGTVGNSNHDQLNVTPLAVTTSVLEFGMNKSDEI